jgi:hypothetical protein
LLSPESFTQDDDQYRQMGENPDIPILGSGVGGHQGVMAQFYGESGRWLDFVIVPPLQGPEGTKPTCFYNPYMTGFDTVITEKCQYPEVAFKWIDGMYEFEIVPFGYKLMDNDSLIEDIRKKTQEVGIEISNYAILANVLQEDRDDYENEIKRLKINERSLTKSKNYHIMTMYCIFNTR